MSRVGKRKRRVAAAEAALIAHRRMLREEVRALAVDARAAATPGRIVLGGLALGTLAGLLTGGRRQPAASPPPAAGAGAIASLTGMVRLASAMMPMLTPLMGMFQAATSPPAAHGDPTPPSAEVPDAAGDPLQ